ncbi:MAG: hypothetical protein KC435_02495 [Thermomicrobiales bacterium]|nr:hypothetical protein [Thermomicrobiales bacterium]
MFNPHATRRTILKSAIAGVAIASASNAVVHADLAAARPFPQHIRYTSGAILPNHISQEEMDAAVKRHYDAWTTTYVRTDGGVGAWIDYDESGATVSEAMGFAMVLAAYMGDKTNFDAFYTYVRAHPSEIGPNLMAWKQELQDGMMVDVEGADSATDGDLDIAYGLLLANAQWGSDGETDYLSGALAVMHDTLTYVVNPELSSLMCGDWSGEESAHYTRSSDFMTGHMLAFAKADTENAAGWEAIHDTITQAVNDVFVNEGEGSGLMPDFLEHTGERWRPVPGEWLETEHDGDLYWNACRTSWRTAMSWLTDGRGDVLGSQQALCAWIQDATDGDPRNIMSGYTIVTGELGQPIEDYSDLAFVAPFAVNAMTGGESAQEWLNTLWDSITGKDFEEVYWYFGDAIRMHVLLTISGNWWIP